MISRSELDMLEWDSPTPRGQLSEARALEGSERSGIQATPTYFPARKEGLIDK
jgi:hypothetical protein